jgi:hypothetical protein
MIFQCVPIILKAERARRAVQMQPASQLPIVAMMPVWRQAAKSIMVRI